MAYDYSAKTLDRWEYPAQAEAYRLKFEHAERELLHWKRRATSAEAQLAMYQSREKSQT